MHDASGTRSTVLVRSCLVNLPAFGYELLRRGADTEQRSDVEPIAEDANVLTAGRRIVCAACRHPITTEAQRIQVKGRHEHRCGDNRRPPHPPRHSRAGDADTSPR